MTAGCGKIWLWGLALLLLAGVRAWATDEAEETVRIRAWGVPLEFLVGPDAEASRLVMDAFRKAFPWIEPVSSTGLVIPGGGRTMDMVPLMQIAGDLAPDVIYVNFRKSDTYIQMKILAPLDDYIEKMAGVSPPDGSAMSTEEYVAALRQGPGWKDEFELRTAPQAWQVIRRLCPWEEGCRHRQKRGLPPLKQHRHTFCFPVGLLVIGLQYDKSLLAEYTDQGVEVRAPRDWEELLKWSKIMTNPQLNHFGLQIDPEDPSWHFMSFLYSAGGLVVKEDENGVWRCAMDDDAAVEAAYMLARLRQEKIVRNGQTIRGVLLSQSAASVSSPQRFAFRFNYLDSRFLTVAADGTWGIAPVPKGPDGRRGSEFNAMMCGIFSGLDRDDPETARRRDAAWEYIRFYDGTEARRIRTQKLVELGLGKYVRRPLLEQFNEDGRYDDLIRQTSSELDETYQAAVEGGVPEPYGKNCDLIYNEIRKPLGEILRSEIIRDAIDRGDAETAKAEIRQILKAGAADINAKVLGNLPPEEQVKREWISWTVIALVLVVFALVLRKVFKAFLPPPDPMRKQAGTWQFGKYAFAYLLMLPALGSIALWMYWPMVRGTVIAFQDYSVLGDSRFVGSANFAAVLFDSEFWYSMWVSLLYTILFIIFGFWVPIALAFLLNEVPRGKTLYRTLYYLPAVLSGAVVIFLWKSFYGPEGLLNDVLNIPLHLWNAISENDVALFNNAWLDDRTWALFMCLLPTVWAGMGPGCLIYLAALKTVPDELYEAADIDGAGIWRKVFNVAVPSIKALVMINFVGAVIGAFRGAGGFVLAMTGGGPYDASGGATEVVGLKLFYVTFGKLQFGAGAAMAWVLGSMLIGFTVLQLQRLSRMEFRTAEKTTV